MTDELAHACQAIVAASLEARSTPYPWCNGWDPTRADRSDVARPPIHDLYQVDVRRELVDRGLDRLDVGIARAGIQPRAQRGDLLETGIVRRRLESVPEDSNLVEVRTPERVGEHANFGPYLGEERRDPIDERWVNGHDRKRGVGCDGSSG